MMTVLSIVFLLLSFPFRGLALAANTVKATASAGQTAVSGAITGMKPVESATRIKKNTSKRRRIRSKLIVNNLKVKKRNTSKHKVVKHIRLGTKIKKAQAKHVKDTVVNTADTAAHTGVKATMLGLQATKLGLITTKLASAAFSLSMKAISIICNFISNFFSLFIPIDIIMTLIALVIVLVGGVISVLFYNNGAYAQNSDNTNNSSNAIISEQPGDIGGDNSNNITVVEDNTTWLNCCKTMWSWYLSNIDTYWGGVHGTWYGKGCSDNQSCANHGSNFYDCGDKGGGNSTRMAYNCDILSNKTVYDDCSAFVSACLVYAGFSINLSDSTRNIGTSIESSGKFTKITSPDGYTPKAGDILVKAGSHTEILAQIDNDNGIIYMFSWGQVPHNVYDGSNSTEPLVGSYKNASEILSSYPVVYQYKGD